MVSRARKSATRIGNAGEVRRARTQNQDRRPRFRCPVCRRSFAGADPPYEREEIPQMVGFCARCRRLPIGDEDFCPGCKKHVCLRCATTAGHWEGGAHSLAIKRSPHQWPIVVRCGGNAYLAPNEEGLEELVAFLTVGDVASAVPFYSEFYSRKPNARRSALAYLLGRVAAS